MAVRRAWMAIVVLAALAGGHRMLGQRRAEPKKAGLLGRAVFHASMPHSQGAIGGRLNASSASC
jgi:hypothetical protein